MSLNGLTPRERYGIWLVDASESASLPATTIRLATVLASGSSALVTGSLAAVRLPDGFTLDRFVVASGIQSPAPPLASGSVNVFQKILFRRLSLLNESSSTVVFQETAARPKLFALVPDLAAQTRTELSATATASSALETTTLAAATSVQLDRLIAKGATLFFEGTFGGNGRTCGTCHPASNNFTIDPAFISTLPATDPLFVAEFNPALAQLERPQLMRAYGLILENLDGLDDPANRFVMRGVPHTLGLQVSLDRDMGLPGAPAQMTGWSGDGAPGTGSLREFAIGAVTQHFTRSLERVAGRDFRLPTEHQLDAMEAFQLSLGRFTDFDLMKITFQDPNVETGRALFVSGTGDPEAGGSCGFCHRNAGALSTNLQNRNFDSNIEAATHPARALEHFPVDGGFGHRDNQDGTYGDRTFNVASVVEAADTPPFFHNNLVNTLEEVVQFYSGPEFNAPPRPASGQIRFNAAQVAQVANFMRAVNVLDNIDVARRELKEILTNTNNATNEQRTRLGMALDGTDDAIQVLNQGGIFPSAVTQLTAARTTLTAALAASTVTERRQLAQQGLATLTQARSALATFAP